MKGYAGTQSFVSRAASSTDVTAITALVNQAYQVEEFFVDGPRTDESEVTALLQRGDFLVVEGRDGGLAGAVEVSVGGQVGHFGMLSVAPSQQSAGLGAMLVREAEHYLRSRGASTVEILVVDRREPLFPWYGRLGYEAVDRKPYVAERPTKIPVEFVVMRKELAPRSALEV